MSPRVKILVVTTALVAGGGLAWLTSAVASDGGFGGAPQVAQAAPPAAQPPAAGGGTDKRPSTFNPRNMCLEHLARRAGNRAYLKVKLDLKPEQLAAWNAFEKAADEAGTKSKASCAALPTEMKVPFKLTDRLNVHEAMMKSRLEALEAVKPSLTTLYAALTPEQQAILDSPMMERDGMHRHHGDRHGRG